MDIIRDVLDNQLVDRNQNNMGKVDGIVIEYEEGKQPKLAYIEVGLVTLARRLHPNAARILTAIQNKWGAKHSEPFRIPWSKVRDVGIDVEIDVDAEATPALIWEKWVRANIISRIPGG